MAALNRIYYTLACLGVSALLLASCLPGDDDLARENEFNQRTQINNTAYSLYQTANNMAGYLTGQSRRLKAPLSEVPITQMATAGNSAEPRAPEGVKVVKCETGMLGAMVYFTQEPKGVPPLRLSGATMVRTLSERHSDKYVGWYANGNVTLPGLAEEKGCTDVEGIVEGSPIFLAGFAYGGGDGNPIVLPDPNKVTWPTVGKGVTLPCPSGFSGNITRKQDCRLITDEKDGETEDVTFRTGVVEMGDVQDPGYELKAVRKKKRWECDPAQDASAPPTTEEIIQFCRNDADNMEKPDDNVITLTAESMKQILEGSGPGYYTYSCRQNADGSNKCDATPYAPTLPETVLRCDRNPVPERYVINPRFPIEVDDAGNVISETPEAATTGEIVGDRDCGNGWTGDLIAGYEVRACQLVKTVNGVETPVKQAQTIYKIGYVGARCKTPPLEATYNCPWPLGGDMVLREEHHMTKPLALQLRSAPRGEWSPSVIPYTGNISPESDERARNQGYVVSDIDLTGMRNPDFTHYLQGAMDTAMQKDITGCKLVDQTCEFPPDPIRLGIVFDRSGSMSNGPLDSISQRMECKAGIRDLFTQPGTACLLLRLGGGLSFIERFLKDKSNPIVLQILEEAINNRMTCDSREMEDIKVGYCTPGKGRNQSTCHPGSCENVNVDLNGVTRLEVAEEQLLTAIGYIPPGSELRYTEYMDNTTIWSHQFDKFCDPMEDDACDFGAEIDAVKREVTKNLGIVGNATPLIESTVKALEQFGSDDGGILIIFSDGEETDGIHNNTGYGHYKNSYPFPFGSFCQTRIPPKHFGTAYFADFCRAIGVTENGTEGQSEDDLLNKFMDLYDTFKCDKWWDLGEDERKDIITGNPGSMTREEGFACTNISSVYNHLTGDLNNYWKTCQSVGNATRPSAIDYIQDKYPNLKVFILDMGGELGACPSDRDGQIVKIPIDDRTSFNKAFLDAFASLNTRSVTPEFVCERVRNRLYPSAVNY